MGNEDCGVMLPPGFGADCTWAKWAEFKGSEAYILVAGKCAAGAPGRRTAEGEIEGSMGGFGFGGRPRRLGAAGAGTAPGIAEGKLVEVEEETGEGADVGIEEEGLKKEPPTAEPNNTFVPASTVASSCGGK